MFWSNIDVKNHDDLNNISIVGYQQACAVISGETYLRFSKSVW